MTDPTTGDAQDDYPCLQHEYGGRYVARRGNQVLASGRRYEILSEQIKHVSRDNGELIVEYVEPPDVASAYCVPAGARKLN